MKAQIVVLLGLYLATTVQARYEFSQKAKDCIVKIKTDEETIHTLATERNPLPEDNELVEQFFGCIFRDFLNDSNELIVDEKLINFITNLVAVRMEGKRKLSKLLAKDLLEHCKNVRQDSKGKTAVHIMNCLKKRFKEYVDE